MITGFVSIKTLIAKIYRDLDINSEIPETSIIEWTAEALSMIGAYSQYDEVSACIDLVNGKAKLPLGFYKLVDVNYLNHPMFWATNTNANNYQCSECKIPVCKDKSCGYTFYLNDNYIITNITTDIDPAATNPSVCMVYLGIHVDEDGYPMIPDNVYYMKALASYVTLMVDTIEWRKGKLTDKVREESKLDWGFYVNSARGAANMPNSAQLNNLHNIMTRLMPLRGEFAKGYVNITRAENINSK